MTPNDPHDPTSSSVGLDEGQLVLRLERLVRRPPEEVGRALRETVLRARGCPCHVVSTIRWNVDRFGDGSRLRLTTWFDGQDIEAAADASARHHACFDDIVRKFDGGMSPPPRWTSLGALTARYVAAVAAVVADTD